MSLALGKAQVRSKTPRLGEGTYMARISSIVDIGVQPMTDWQTHEPTESKPRVLITWTLPTETIEREQEDGTVENVPRVLSKEYTLSNHEKSNIVKLVMALKPDCKVLNELLDRECMLSVGSTNKDANKKATEASNDKVEAVVKTPKGMTVDPLPHDAIFFDFDDPNEENYMFLPHWIQGKIKDAENYSGFADSWGEQEESA